MFFVELNCFYDQKFSKNDDGMFQTESLYFIFRTCFFFYLANVSFVENCFLRRIVIISLAPPSFQLP